MTYPPCKGDTIARVTDHPSSEDEPLDQSGTDHVQHRRSFILGIRPFPRGRSDGTSWRQNRHRLHEVAAHWRHRWPVAVCPSGTPLPQDRTPGTPRPRRRTGKETRKEPQRKETNPSTTGAQEDRMKEREEGEPKEGARTGALTVPGIGALNDPGPKYSTEL